jgi:WD40 repeat protein
LDIKNFTKTKHLSLSTRSASSIVFDNKNEIYLNMLLRPNVFKYSLKNGNLIKTFNAKKQSLDYISVIKVSDDQKYLVAGTQNYSDKSGNTVKIWDIKTNKLLYNLQGHTDDVYTVGISGDSKYVLSGSKDTTVKYWDIKAGKNIKTYDLKHRSAFGIQSVVFHPDNKRFLAASFDKISFVDIKTGEIIREYEKDSAQVLKFTKDGSRFFSGCYNGNIHLWNTSTGKLIKTFKGHKLITHSLFLSEDEKVLYSTSADKTIKIWDIKSGKEVISLYSLVGKEWIAMTPEGYFNASPNGAKYLNVLTGPMNVTSVDAYYETFYRPDIVAKALDGVTSNNKTAYAYNEPPKLKLSDIKPAPDLEIVKTSKNIDKEELKVTLKITPKQKDEYGQIRLYLDGTLIKTDNDRTLKIKKEDNSIYKTYTLKIPKGKHTIRALVFNKNNTMQSRDALHTVTSTFNPIVKPNIYAVVIGINEYKNPTLTLKYAVPDAKLFADTIKNKTQGLFEKVDVKLLTTKADTTKENITKTLKSLQNLNPQDMFIFYVASHGMVEDAKYHMITSNVGALSTRKIKQDAISQETMKELIANIPTTKKFVILDTCNSGALGQALEVALLTRGLNETTAMKVLSRAVGSTIISASSSTQEALEGYKGHGLLTYVLSEGLKGKADSDNDGFVKTLEISNYVEDTVPEIAEKEFNRAQYPYVSPLGQGFPLVKTK